MQMKCELGSWSSEMMDEVQKSREESLRGKTRSEMASFWKAEK